MKLKRIKRNIRPILTFARIDVKRLFRDKVAIFFTLVFPLLFLFVFGGVFGKDSSVSFDIAIVNDSTTQFSKDFEASIKQNELFKVNDSATTADLAKEKMSRGELDATIILPVDFGSIKNGKYPSGQALVLYDENNVTAGQTLSSVLESIFSDINAGFVTTETPFTVKSESTDTKGLTQFDYIFSGLLGFSLLTLGIFGPSSVYPRLKQRGVLRRYRTTTLRVWQYFVANILSNSIYGLISIATMFLVALTIFDLSMQGSYIDIAIFVMFSSAVLFGIGLAIGGWAKNENQSAPVANIITFPMIFLSGSFFPRFLMPEWLQSISNFLPLTPVIDGSRLIITEGYSLIEVGPQIGLIAVWGIIIYFIAIKLFRWE